MTKRETEKISRQMLDFIAESPTGYHAAANIKKKLCSCGYRELHEGDKWKLEAGEKYFTIRNGSSLIAFNIPKTFTGFHIVAAHDDSPAFKLKEHADMETGKRYLRLNVEKYGGMIYSSWVDRPLSVAGRITVRTKTGICTRLVDFARNLVLIPGLAIHMNPEINKENHYNLQEELLPLAGMAGENFLKRLSEEAGVAEDEILGQDLFLYNRQKGSLFGLNREFVASPRLDDLMCVFAAMEAFTEIETQKSSVPVLCIFDNEETGSSSRQGALSTFLADVLERINAGCKRNEEEYKTALASSFMISADNAHSYHPNYPLKADPTNAPVMNGGIVIKFNASQKYTTDSVSAAIFKSICDAAGVPYQTYFNRSDIPGGSTLGNLSGHHVSVNTADIGLAQLSMHSAYETAGTNDCAYMIRALKKFYESELTHREPESCDIGF